MEENNSEWQRRVWGGRGAVSVRVDVTQDVVNEGRLRRSGLDSTFSLQRARHEFNQCSFQACINRIPTMLTAILLNGVVPGIKSRVGDHGVTPEHYGHDVGRGEEGKLCASTESAHGE